MGLLDKAKQGAAAATDKAREASENRKAEADAAAEDHRERDLEMAAHVENLGKWQYLSIRLAHPRLQDGKLKRGDLDKELDRAGEQGWELVSFFPNVDLYAERDGALLLFKRPAPG